MKKKLISWALVLTLYLSLLPVSAFAADSDFIIKDGVLTGYKGSGGDVVIPEEVTAIGGNLTLTKTSGAITSLTIPGNLDYIGKFAFSGFASTLSSITITGSVAVMEQYAFASLVALKEVEISNAICIENYAFNVCPNLTNVTIHHTEYIGEYAFSFCDSLRELTIDNVGYIDDYAFTGCSALSQVNLPDNVVFESDTFSGCNLLPAQYQPEQNLTQVRLVDGFSISSTGGLVSYHGTGGDIVIPDNVIIIKPYAFAGCDAITSVTIPDSVMIIGECAFLECSNLTDVTLGRGLIGLQDLSFENCSSLKRVVFPPLEEQESSLKSSRLYDVFTHSSSIEEIVNCPNPDVAQNLAHNELLRELWNHVNPDICIVSQSERITALSNQICAGLTSHYDKAKAIFDWVTSNIEYDYDYYYHKKTTVALQAEEVLEVKLTVCEGYSRLMQALLQAQGIPAVYVRGTSNNSSGTNDHAWNMAYVDNRWIYIDSTWGRPSTYTKDGTTYDYDPSWFDSSALYVSLSHNGDSSSNGAAVEKTLDTPVSGFQDVPNTSAFSDSVTWAVENGITTGYADGTFRPNNACTVAQILTFLWREQGSEELNYSGSFCNSFRNTPYYPAMIWSFYHDITYSGRDSYYSASCTRLQAVCFLYAAANRPVVDSPASVSAKFGDLQAVTDPEELSAVAWAVEQGITQGTGDGSTFAPDSPCTRGQIMTFLYRAYA